MSASPPPMQVPLWSAYVLGECLREAGGDVGAALEAAGYILATQPVPASFALSTDAQGHEHRGKGEGGGQFTTKGGGGNPRGAFRRALVKLGDAPVARHLRAASKKLQKVTKDFFHKVEERYGRKVAVATLVAGQAVGWGATGVGALAGIPVWLPGSSLWGGLPVVAIAEVVRQIRRMRGAKLAMDDDVDRELVEKLAKELHDLLAEALKKYLADNEDELSADRAMSTDASGHEHRSKGPRGGEFVSKYSHISEYHGVPNKTVDKLISQQVNLANHIRKKGGLPLLSVEDYELSEHNLSEVTPTQHGEDYENDSSRELSKYIHQFGSSDRLEDYAPIIVDEKMQILDGNHRHAARKMAGKQTIPVLVPKRRSTLSFELSTDAQGHEHRGKGPRGGQFTSKGSGGGGKPEEKTRVVKSGAKSSQKEITRNIGSLQYDPERGVVYDKETGELADGDYWSDKEHIATYKSGKLLGVKNVNKQDTPTEDSGSGGEGSKGWGEGVQADDTRGADGGDKSAGKGPPTTPPETFAEARERLTAAKLNPLGEHAKTVLRDRRNYEAYGVTITRAAEEAGILIKEDQLPYVGTLSEDEKQEEDDGGKDIGGFEHRVYIDEEENRVYKITRGPYHEGMFGLSKDAHDYLQRLETASKLWPSLGYKFHGIIDLYGDGKYPTIATSMNRVSGTRPTQGEIDEWFDSMGWAAINPETEYQYAHGWVDPKTGTIVKDTHPGNFIKTEAGLVPIDVVIEPDVQRKIGTAQLSTDAQGHEHKGKGSPEGGEFTSKGNSAVVPKRIWHTYNSKVGIHWNNPAGVFGITHDDQPNEYGDKTAELVIEDGASVFTAKDQADAIRKLVADDKERKKLLSVYNNGGPKEINQIDRLIAEKLRKTGHDIIHYNESEQYGEEWAVINPDVIKNKDAFMKRAPIAFSHDIHNPEAQGILKRTLKKVRGLNSRARQDLAAALDAPDRGEAILAFVAKYRNRLARLLTVAQMASLLEGAREVAGKIPPPGAVPTEGLPVAEQERIAALPPASVSPPFVPPEPPPGSPESAYFPVIERAIRDLAERNVLARDQYDLLGAAARAKAFTVANVQAEETLIKIRDSLAENMREGADYETWKGKILQDLDSGTFMSPNHMETVFRTNVQSAFSDGQMAILAHPLVRSGFPYSAYDAIHDDRVRDNHLALESHGIQKTNVYRNDDPVFQLFRPPWDYNDRCSWTPITVRQAAERGVEEAQEWLRTGVEPSPRAHVPMPPFQPPPRFRREVSAAPLSIQLSMHPMATFAHDVSQEKRDESGRWTRGGLVHPDRTGEITAEIGFDGLKLIKQLREDVREVYKQYLGVCKEMSTQIEVELGVKGVIGVRNGIEHHWNEFKDGSILDSTADQFGDSPIILVKPTDSLYQQYHSRVGKKTTTSLSHDVSQEKRDESGRWTDDRSKSEWEYSDDLPSHDSWKELEADPNYFYHATNKDNASDIQESAMRGHRPWHGTDQSAWPDGSTAKRIYFSDKPSTAWQFAPEEGHPALLRVRRHESVKPEKGTSDFYLEGKKIPPHRVEIYTKDGWKPLRRKSGSASLSFTNATPALSRVDLISEILVQLYGDDARKVASELVKSGDISLSISLATGPPKVKRRYGRRPGPGWTQQGTSRKGIPVWVWQSSRGAAAPAPPPAPHAPAPQPPVPQPHAPAPPAPAPQAPTPPPTAPPAPPTPPTSTPAPRKGGQAARAASIAAHTAAMAKLNAGQQLTPADKASLSKKLTNMPVGLLRTLHTALGAGAGQYGNVAVMKQKDLVSDVKAILTGNAPTAPAPAAAAPAPNVSPAMAALAPGLQPIAAEMRAVALAVKDGLITRSDAQSAIYGFFYVDLSTAGDRSKVLEAFGLDPNSMGWLPDEVINTVGAKDPGHVGPALTTPPARGLAWDPVKNRWTDQPVSTPAPAPAPAPAPSDGGGASPFAGAKFKRPPINSAAPPAPASNLPPVPYKDEVKWETGTASPGTLNGVDFAPAPPKFWENTKDVDVGEPPPLKKINRVGVMIQEPDGRVWIVQPTNQYGNRNHTLPGGGVEPGLTDQQNALKEVWEETGLQVEITGHLGDFEDSNNSNNGRLYIGKRIGGQPWDAKIESHIISQKTGKASAESESVTLVTLEHAAKLLHRTDDLAQLMTVHPPPLDTPTKGKGSEALKKFFAAVQPKSVDYRKKNAKGDGDLHAIQEMRGFNKKPEVLKKNDFDKLMKQGGHIEMLRGVRGYFSSALGRRINAKDLSEQFRTGDHFPGYGCFGNGTYADAQKGSGNAANSYASGNGEMIRLALPKNAKIIKQSELEKKVPSPPPGYTQTKTGSTDHSEIYQWWGVQAAIAGYDAIEIDGGSKYHYSYGSPAAGNHYHVILNRSILVVQEEEASGHIIK